MLKCSNVHLSTIYLTFKMSSNGFARVMMLHHLKLNKQAEDISERYSHYNETFWKVLLL